MKKITVYETDDGELFKNKSEAEKHDNVQALIETLRGQVLPKRFDTCAFANGEGFIQLTQAQVGNLEQEFIKAVKKFHKSFADIVSKNPRGIVGRYLCDNDSPLYSTYCLMSQIDTSNRLWGQPYFANNPSDGKQVQLNK